MIKRIAIAAALALAMSACIPILTATENISMTVVRDGTANDGVDDTVTGTVHLGRTLTEPVVLFQGDGFQWTFKPGTLEPGDHVFVITTDTPVACSVSGFFGRRQILPIPCQSP